MTKFTRLDAHGVAIEVCSAEAHATHEPTLAATFIECPDSVTAGATLISGTWQAFVPPEPPAPRPPRVTPPQFFLLFTMAEQVALEGLRSSTPWLNLFFKRLEDPRLTEVDLSLESVQGGVAQALALVHTGDTSARVAEVLTGVWR